jgi:uroporphyrin-III C-methyltransferase/precorrin-2 dehydrogenase/sirohydrochlorin ferrochelatase
MHIVSRQPSDQSPARMAPLSVLPVFLALQGKRTVVLGGSDAAAWKAELLAAAGAVVDVHAAELSDEFKRVLGCTGTLVHHATPWTAETFAGAAIVVADAETDEEAEAVYGAAHTAGVPVNVIDKPTFCDFMFGSIVNRSPVVVGISTEGAAPILGQAIRRRIETLLPHSLQAWAGLAQKLRAPLNDRLRPGSQRRTFWERFVDRAFGPAPTPADELALRRDIDRIAATDLPRAGRVTLVGAGPGDAELLTLKAVRALQSADTILFDDLVSDDVLDLARREAKRILVGKRSGRPSCRQEEINELMLKLARAGKHVVRLKSGDPMIFGRAGEEIAQLDAAGIPVEIVPGITAGVALAAALGISLTHRDCARSVRFITGHSRQGGLPEDLDWRSVADPATTTIFYMAGRTASQIVARLAAYDLVGDTPIAVASSLSHSKQRLWQGALRDLLEIIAEAGDTEPVILGIGNAFGQRQQHGAKAAGLDQRDGFPSLIGERAAMLPAWFDAPQQVATASAL